MLREGGNAVDAAVCRGARLVRGREPADRVRRRRLHDGPPGRGDRPDRLLRRRAGQGRGRARGRAGPGAGPLRRRDGADVLRRARLLRRAGHRGGAGAGAASASARRRSPSWSARRSALAREGAPVNAEQAYILDILAPIHERLAGTRELYAPDGRPLREGDVFRFPELAEALERFGAEGAEPFYRGEVAAALSEFVGRARRHARARRPRRLRGDRAAADPGAVPRHRGADQPAALLGRDPDRLLPRPARAARRAQRPRAAGRRDGRRQRRPRRGVRRGALRRGPGGEPARPGRRSTCAAGDLLGSTTHISVLDGDGMCASVTCSNGSGSGVLVPGHRGDPQQHARRGGPQPARLPRDRAGPPGAVDDGADRGPARRRDRARPRQRRLQPDPLGDPADDRAGGRAGDGRRRGGAGAAPALRGRASSRPSRGSTRRRWRGSRRAASRSLRRPADQPLLRRRARRSPAIRDSGALSGGGDPRRGGAVAVA